ncbi:LysR family transcriptional regulator [Vibrio quintilis]|uniref:LysR family transcriptional regulator n=1 Tax=Vibrio quintilis TaxID=1117707 RepID=UPI0021C7B7A0|nr:LysR family transcriptional regulator [Vibrio quintilis]
MALFVEVGKYMNFRRAADALDMPSSTLSRRISYLESEIGLRLLHRTTRKVEFTEAGLIYYERCKRIVSEANLAHEQLGDMATLASGLLRASVPVDFATVYLAPALAEFVRLYPNINFELDMSPRRAGLVTENVDVAIRIGESPDSTLIARKLTQFQGQLYSSPNYLKKIGVPDHPSILKHHQCIGFPKMKTWVLTDGNKKVSVEINGRFSLNNIGMMKRLAVLGQGIILIPQTAIESELETGDLVPVLPQWFANPVPVYAITETKLLPAKVRVFIDFLKQYFN